MITLHSITATINAARILNLKKGAITAGGDADVIVLHADTLKLRDVFAGGRVMRTAKWTRKGMFEGVKI
jgi:adenine deaminase